MWWNGNGDHSVSGAAQFVLLVLAVHEAGEQTQYETIVAHILWQVVTQLDTV